MQNAPPARRIRPPTVTLSASTFRIHRWLGWLVGVQVLIWVAGGMVFSLLPFQSWVKGGDTVKPPKLVMVTC